VWFWRKSELKDELIQSLQGEIAYLRKQHDLDCQRIDRLTEALARRANVDLILPIPDPPPPERVHVPNPWKDPNLVTDRFPESDSAAVRGKKFPESESVGASAATGTPKFSKEKV